MTDHAVRKEMKRVMLLILIAMCFVMTGCGTMAHIMQSTFITQPDHGVLGNTTDEVQSIGFRVYNSNPYAVHLEIEESDPNQELDPLNGDGGASLNAYAACLTLKVIF
jgi:hypothetical protein